MIDKLTNRITQLVLLAFFISGGCGLVYEVLWTRYLANLIGATSMSQMLVLLVFMGGLALGALLFGRLVDRGKDGLLLYAYLEIGIGIYALCFPFLVDKVNYLFVASIGSLQPGTFLLNFLKILYAVLLIAAPSVAMGGTLPVLTRYITGTRMLLRRNISLLYGLNSLGAVLGALVAGFYLVHHYGMDNSMIMTGVASTLLGFAALWGSRLIGRYDISFTDNDSIRQRRTEDVLDQQTYKPDAVKRAIIGAGISGFAAMALQIAWIRYFAIVLGATHSAFTLVAAAFIFGIGLGSLLVSSRSVGRIPLPTVLTGAFALTAITMGIGLFFYARAPFEIGRAMSVFSRTPIAWLPYEMMKFGISFVLMLLPCLASGMILPVCVRIAGMGEERIGRDVAMVYSVNTLGALLGIGITSQLFFRLFSLPRTLQLIFFVYVGTAIFLAAILEEKGRKRIFASLVLLALFHISMWKPWDPHHIYVNQLRFGQNPPLTYESFIKSQDQEVVVEERQGPDVQVAVLDTFDKTPYRVMYINGKPDASNDPNGPDLVTEILLANLPMLLHPAPHSVFVLGVGSGITSGEALKHPKIGEVVTVELAREVFEASKHFARDNGRYWENPLHQMVIEDGKTFLQISKQKFDIIALEPTNLWQDGMAGLFSEDFFKLARDRLAKGGILAQWLHTYKVDNMTLSIVLKSFSRAFPKASIFEMGQGDLLLVGYDEDWSFDPLKTEHNFYRPQILASMKRIGVTSAASLLMREMMARDSFDNFTRVLDAPINTDNFPVLEQAAEYGKFIGRAATLLQGYDSRLDPDASGLLLNKYIEQIGFDSSQTRDLIDTEIASVNERVRNSFILRLLSKEGSRNKGEAPPEDVVSFLKDPALREVVHDPAYNRNPFLLSPNESLGRIADELLIWSRASSAFWSPDPRRLHGFHERLVSPSDPVGAGVLGLRIALPLTQARACRAALPFLRLAEEAGAMTSENMRLNDIVATFYCEVKEGDPQRALAWWNILEENEFRLSKEIYRDKATLDIKLGGEPPSPYYGRIPPRW